MAQKNTNVDFQTFNEVNVLNTEILNDFNNRKYTLKIKWSLIWLLNHLIDSFEQLINSGMSLYEWVIESLTH